MVKLAKDTSAREATWCSNNGIRAALSLNMSLPGILLNAVNGGRAGGAIIHDNRLPCVVGIRRPVLCCAIRISIGGGCESIVVSLVDHGTALAWCSL